MTESSSRPSWYAVRCVFAVGWPPDARGKTYEERVTLWRAGSSEEAIERAEAEALEYAGTIDDSPSTYLELAQSYYLADEPGDGAEVYSLMRDSDLPPEEYLDTFFDTGSERQRAIDVSEPDALDGAEPGARDVTARLTWDHDDDIGYLALCEISDGDARHQVIVTNPVPGREDLILDFDRDGRLLGIEYFGARVLPPGHAAG